jgi:hypothetical protein
VIRRATILYEDQVEGKVTAYGPHALVKQCLCDRLSLAPWDIKGLDPLPKKGNGNVWKDCQRNLKRLANDGRTVFAVYDSDRIRDLVKLPPSACKALVISRLKEGCEPADKLVVILLERNIETVIQVICALDPSVASPEEQANALHRKDLTARDTILRAAAAPTPPRRVLREQVLAQVPSLRRLIDKLMATCAPAAR